MDSLAKQIHDLATAASAEDRDDVACLLCMVAGLSCLGRVAVLAGVEAMVPLARMVVEAGQQVGEVN